MTSKVLLAFDFDRTITNENTDVVALEMLAQEDQDELWSHSYKKGEWTKFMNAVFETLCSRNVTIENLQAKIMQMDLNNGMQELFQHIESNKLFYDCIIISDSNAWFIDLILHAKNLQHIVKKVFTNPASVVDNKKLHISPCHSHSHFSCPSNMCKGELLQNYIKDSNETGIYYSSVCYFGDGTNDFCPSLTLQKSDFVFPRKGFALEKKLNEESQKGKSAHAKVIPWESAFETIDLLPVPKYTN